LRCPGCYAYEPAHLNSDITLRQLSDFRGDDLVAKILALVDEHRPLHVSLVGGDPLVRYRELEVLLPQLSQRGIHVQVVTSAFRALPAEWSDIPGLNIVVSIDGLQAEHDVRRKPATYERILKTTEAVPFTVHCTITSQMMARERYLDEFVEFWSAKTNVRRIWFSMFTPQLGASDIEILNPEQRGRAIEELNRLRSKYSKLDLNGAMLREYANPPKSPKECIFARTTTTISADLKTRIEPCQFGGRPDCSQCGCVASMGLAALGHYKVLPGITAGGLFRISEAVGSGVNRLRKKQPESDDQDLLARGQQAA
jgi:organic radical activating enzyme